LLARPALVVESNDTLGRAAHVRHDEDMAVEPLAMCYPGVVEGT
jgi:hypothetical protein